MHHRCMINQATTSRRIADEVRAEMGRQRKSQADLARALGMHASTVSRRLDGSSAFDISELVTLAEWLGVSASTLLARAEARASTSAVA